jgi:hypothetical protein
VYVWVRKKGGAQSAPTDSSVGRITIGRYSWEPIVYFASAQNDTVRAFNNHVLIWYPGTWPYGQNSDTLDAVWPDNAPSGVIPVSVGFTARQNLNGPSLSMALKWDSIPAGFDESDIRAYVVNAQGEWVECGNYVLHASANMLSVQRRFTEGETLILAVTNRADPRIPVLIPYTPKYTLDTRPLLRWHPVDSAENYTVQIDTTRIFVASIAVVPLSDTTYRPGVALPIRTVYWRVQSSLTAAWSAVDSFTILTDSIPFLVRYDGDSVATRRPVFQWSQVTGAASYRVELAENRAFTGAISVPLADTTYTPGIDLAIGRWYWRVSCSRNPSLFSPIDSLHVGIVGNTVRAPNRKAITELALLPASRGVLTVLVPATASSRSVVRVYDMVGRQVAEILLDGCGEHRLDLSSCLSATGAYFAQLRNADKVKAIRLIQ